ncbi:serine protein kinase RIO [Persicimonas caeni]|uniref:non-specific serine/threonine protein kinase n=1 Tax=Persicimonas caeni TaxID=2292766 RepID=A0A4Y6PLY7_PERCE|nr:RIO1 family regulatory kinase/ATPase [Persicimonas caeni]QDG49326.1 serine protein kinase RIO [Persicimonas caeni]QED30547.1 serine protein kinase RIO [Persicimonas caeni]
MRMPPRLVPLIEYGVIESVVRPLLSGKEAQVYLVESGGELRAAKVYKDMQKRSFRNRSEYTESRKVRNSRDRRAMGKRSRYGREQEEAAWNSAEADMIKKLYAAGVRVPKPHTFVDGVLVMECVEGPDGGVAPRIADCALDKERGVALCDQILREVVKMLCADVVHADLSVFNVLLEEDGPVIIDFPQSIAAARNNHARKILLRDVANITDALRFGRPPHELRYGYEMWDLYERGELKPDSELTGKFDVPQHDVDPDILLLEMQQVEEDEALAAIDEDLVV